MEAVTIKRSIWINAPRQRVWEAVTVPEQIAGWFAPGMTFKNENNIISILMDGQYVDVAWVEVVEPPRQLTTRGLPNKLIATTYLLEEENGGTRFTFVGTADIRLQKGLNIGGRRVDAILDVYNLSNFQKPVEEYPVVGPRSRATTAIQPPLAVHMGVRLTL